jgi:NADH dehydrogenase
VRIAVRNPDAARTGSRISAISADVRDETAVARALEGCDAAINAVGLYVEKGPATFSARHVLGARNVARQAATLSLKRLVHISGIGGPPYDGGLLSG